jgi:DNA-binding NarL/FixJ family response regulator
MHVEKEEWNMRCYWEQIGILGPIYRSLSQGLSDSEIARKLNLTEVSVESCVAWILHFLKLKNRQDLVLYASAAA